MHLNVTTGGTDLRARGNHSFMEGPELCLFRPEIQAAVPLKASLDEEVVAARGAPTARRLGFLPSGSLFNDSVKTLLGKASGSTNLVERQEAVFHPAIEGRLADPQVFSRFSDGKPTLFQWILKGKCLGGGHLTCLP